MHAVVRALDGSAVDRRRRHHDLVVEAALQVLDDAVCVSGVAGGSTPVAADGDGRVLLLALVAALPLHSEGVGAAVQVCYHLTGQTGSCWVEHSCTVGSVSHFNDYTNTIVQKRKWLIFHLLLYVPVEFICMHEKHSRLHGAIGERTSISFDNSSDFESAMLQSSSHPSFVSFQWPSY